MDILNMDLIDNLELMKLLSNKMKKDSRSLRDVSAHLNISKSTLSNILSGQGMNMKANQLIKIIYYLDINLKDLIHQNCQEELESITYRYKSFDLEEIKSKYDNF